MKINFVAVKGDVICNSINRSKLHHQKAANNEKPWCNALTG